MDGFTTVELSTTDVNGDSIGAKEKRVVGAELTIEHQDPGPDRRVLEIETRDGWVYSFQRYGGDEPWIRYQRHKPEGEAMTGLKGILPNAIDDFLENFEKLDVDVDRAIGAPTSSPDVVIADGGQDQLDEGEQRCDDCDRAMQAILLEDDLCPACDLGRRNEERREERGRQTTWVDDASDPEGYGDRL